MMWRWIKCSIVGTVLLASGIANAQNQEFTGWGTEFWLPVPTEEEFLAIETRQDAQVTIENLDLQTIDNYVIPGNSVEPIKVFQTVQSPLTAAFAGLTLHITSDVPIAISFFHDHSNIKGGIMRVLPVTSLGTEYTVSTHYIESENGPSLPNMVPILYITATEDNTDIEVITAQDSDMGFTAGVPSYLSLNAGETYPVDGLRCRTGNPFAPFCDTLTPFVTNDLSGTTIRACKPVSVMLYYTLHKIEGPYEPTCCSDASMETYYPHRFWGNEFVVVPEQHVIHGNLLKVFSKTDGTEITLNNSTTVTLNKDETLDTLVFERLHIQSTEDIWVSQYFFSSNAANPGVVVPGGEATDPEILFVPPINYRTRSGNFDVSIHPNMQPVFSETGEILRLDSIWLSITTDASNIGNIAFDGQPISPSAFAQVGNSSYANAYFTVSNTFHSVTATQGTFQGTVIANLVHGGNAYYFGIDGKAAEPPFEDVAIECDLAQSIILNPIKQGDTYEWSTGEFTESIEVSQPGTYWVDIFNFCGDLIASDTFEVNCIECPEQIEFPNVFSPNFDNANDLFSFEIPTCYISTTFRIVNRWGNVVFVGSPEEMFWDGTIRGAEASEGTYFWYFTAIQADGTYVEQHGFVELVR